ncbi:hypothetical protein SpCBS45565_g00744 [Spizellomyces sp. 'palustris']|nr:hypothetical protein SpCBS45565_g00744 [Spizellomyces sp. 'palustris']
MEESESTVDELGKRNASPDMEIASKRRRHSAQEVDVDEEAPRKVMRYRIQLMARLQAQMYLKGQREGDERNRQRQELFARMVEVVREVRRESGQEHSSEEYSDGFSGTPRAKNELPPYSLDGSPDLDRDGKPFQCDIPGCERKFKKLNGLISHHHAAHASGGINDPKPFKCNIPGCSKAYRNSNGLAYHLENGHGGGGVLTRPSPMQPKVTIERSWYCPYKGCDKTYKNLKGLVYHLQKGKASGHNVDLEGRGVVGVFVCAVPACGKTFKSPQALVGHVETTHADMDPIVSPSILDDISTTKIVDCQSCMRQFRNTKSLAHHVATVHQRETSPRALLATCLSNPPRIPTLDSPLHSEGDGSDADCRPIALGL